MHPRRSECIEIEVHLGWVLEHDAMRVEKAGQGAGKTELRRTRTGALETDRQTWAARIM